MCNRVHILCPVQKPIIISKHDPIMSRNFYPSIQSQLQCMMQFFNEYNQELTMV